MFDLVLDVATRVSNISVSTHLFILRPSVCLPLLQIRTRLIGPDPNSLDEARSLAQSMLKVHLSNARLFIVYALAQLRLVAVNFLL